LYELRLAGQPFTRCMGCGLASPRDLKR